MEEEKMILTLLIKAANQQIDDHTVQCDDGWTIRQLKQHLTQSYPTTPSPKQQRLIFSGKLLQDHLTLKEVLRNFPDETTHIVHLVCAATVSNNTNKPAAVINNKPPPTQQRQPPPTQQQPHQQLPQQPQPSYQQPQQSHNQESTDAWQQYYQSMYQQYWANSAPGNYTPTHAYLRPGHMTSQQPYMTPEQQQYMSHQQYMTMRRMYATQYIMQYMQYYGYPQATPFPVTPLPPDSPLPPPLLPNQPPLLPDQPPILQPPPAPVAPAAPANQNLVMNAQGGQMEEEDEMARDWLDWVYVLCRFSVLLCIIYFYSTFSRFFAVMILFVLFYIYQNGYLLLPRRNARPPADPVQPQQAPVQEPANENPEPAAENAAPTDITDTTPTASQDTSNSNSSQDVSPESSQPHDTRETESTHDASDTTQNAPDNTQNAPDTTQNASDTTQNAPDIQLAPPAPQLSILYIAWCFISSFFTSLLPQRPPDVNAN